jgi:hypothetical protein
MMQSEISELRDTVYEAEASIVGIAAQFTRINRLLLVLIRRKARLQYEYRRSGTTIYFRVRVDGGRAERSRESLMQIFRFTSVDFHGFRSFNCCAISFEGDIMQVEITAPTLRADGTNDLLSVLWAQSDYLLSKLPEHSSAALFGNPVAS